MTADSLATFYAELDSRHGVLESGNYDRLVVPTGNSDEPVHRWFHVKEAFSHELLERLLKDLLPGHRGRLSIADPFSGSGTTATSAAALVERGGVESVRVEATEVNPFLHLLSDAKFEAFKSPAPGLLPLARRTAAAVANGLVPTLPTPSLSTFSRADYFEPSAVASLVALRELILGDGRATELERRLALVAVGAAVEPSSRLRRDGRALRFTPTKRVTEPVEEFLRVARLIDEDLPDPSDAVTGQISLGDARAPGEGSDRHDLVVFSPPYPNNIDYTEVYKLEAWALGLIDSQVEFTQQRHRTLRSHPSIRFGPAPGRAGALEGIVGDLAAPLMAAIPEDGRYARARHELVSGYLEDMAAVLSSAYASLRPGGALAYIVGNSLHGTGSDGVLIAADVLLAELARGCGFEDIQIDVARRPSRRGQSTYLRESVVTARKPEAAIA